MIIFKYFLLISFMLLVGLKQGLAQNAKTDSLLKIIPQLEDDSVKVLQYLELGLEFMGSDINKAIFYLDEAIQLGYEINYEKGLANAYNSKGRAYAQQGNLEEAILNFQDALKHFQAINDRTGEANILSNIGSIYFMRGNSTKALELHFQSLKISEELGNKLRIGTSYNNIGTVYLKNRATINDALIFFKKSLDVFQNIEQKMEMATAAMNIGEVYFFENEYDSAIYYHQFALEHCDGTLDATFPLTQLGEIYSTLGDFPKAFEYHNRSLEISVRLNAKFEITQGLIGLAKTLRIKGDYGAAISALERAKVISEEIDAKNESVEIFLNLAEIYAIVGDYKAAYENEINAKFVSEEIAKSSTEKMIQQLQFDFELDKKEAEIELLQKDTQLKNAAVYSQKIIIIGSLIVLLMFVIISVYLYKNNLRKQKANSLLQRQKEEIYAQRENAESAYEQLKSTQALLIQSEKMASLGELTAGVAHEIQNPMNFINNFSEVSSELILEIQELRIKSQATIPRTEEDELEDEILEDVRINLEKINHHGKRVDGIVKGMLEHSRASSGEKVLTDINALAAEYLRLSYHGIMAKDKTYKAEMKTDFDPTLPKINIIPQDIGRVLLNIINNAFQAVGAGNTLQPMVTLSTKNLGDHIEISIHDNGPGIPESIKDKIFQPFFTTKPTGQGTGLGLSLSYDIVHAYGGELEVETAVNFGTTFIIKLHK